MATNANRPKPTIENGRPTKRTYSAGSEYLTEPARQSDDRALYGVSSRSGVSRVSPTHADSVRHASRTANSEHTRSAHSRADDSGAALSAAAKGGKTHQKKRRYSKRKILRFVFFIVFCVSMVVLVGMLIDYKKSRNEYDELNALAVSAAELTEDHAAQNDASSDAVATPKMISGSLPWEKQERIAAEVGITVDWDALRNINKYVAAWLYSPDTNISYPVVQYKDNEYFLNRNFNRREDESGTLFFDYRNILSDGRENWIIYGHRRNDKSMFGSLAKYAKEEYLAEHPVMYLLMPDRSYRVEIFSCRTVHAEQQYFTLWFNDSAAYTDYLEKAVMQSYWTPTFTPDTAYPILTLATCSTYVGDDEPRLLVHGRLVPIE